MIRDTARDFAAKELAPRIQKAYLEEKTDPKLFRLMGEAGLLGVTLPQEFGCAGAGYVSYGLVAREVERVNSGFRSMMSVQSSLVMYPIYAYGDAEQQQEIPAGPRARRAYRLFWAHRAGRRLRPWRHDDAGREDRRRLSADRRRRPGSATRPFADVFVVWAKSRAHGDKIRGFILEKGMKGLSAPKIEGKLSLARLDHRRDRARQRRSAGERAIAERQRASRARSAASIGRATASPGGRWARRRIAGLPRANTVSTASNSAARSPRPSSSRRSSPTCRPGSRSGSRRR